MRTISIIIPCMPGVPVPANAAFLRNSRYPPDKIEVILVSGNNPSRQRNLGARVAGGEILCFLDDDSIIPPGYLEEAERGIPWDDPLTAAGGGPCLPVSKDTVGRLLAAALTAFCFHYRMRARYLALGHTRLSGERELIGCNLLVKRDVFLGLGGFREELYPNEENELLNRLSRSGYRIWHDPRLTVKKKIDLSFPGFLRKFFRYGGGRGTQLFLEPLRFSILYLLPPALLLYVFSLAVIPASYRWAAAVYACFVLIESAVVSVKRRDASFMLLTAIIPLIHASYAAGMLVSIACRLFRVRKKISADYVEVRKIKRFDGCARAQVML